MTQCIARLTKRRAGNPTRKIASEGSSWISRTIAFTDMELRRDVPHARIDSQARRDLAIGQATVRAACRDELRPEAAWL
jgi:DNA-binding transcriptional regulator YdaS (Cro superfamily)